MGVMFAGKEKEKEADLIYIASNAYWEELDVLLPSLPEDMHWEMVVDTWQEEPIESRLVKENIRLEPRSVAVFVGVKNKKERLL